MARDDRVNALLPVEVEFQKEKAFGLRRTGLKLDDLLAELAKLELALRAAQEGPARARHLAQYREVRKQAEYQKWCLMVQREACGLRNHRDLDLLYPLPPPLRE